MYTSWRPNGFFRFELYVMGLHPLYILLLLLFGAEIDFRRQNLTSIDIRF